MSGTDTEPVTPQDAPDTEGDAPAITPESTDAPAAPVAPVAPVAPAAPVAPVAPAAPAAPVAPVAPAALATTAEPEPEPKARKDAPKKSLALTDEQQAHVDQMVGKARQESRDRAYRYVFERTGAQDLEELVSLVTEARERRARNHAELEDARAQIAALEGRVHDESQGRTEATHQAHRAARLAALRLEAIKQGFTDTDDPVRFLDVDKFAVDPQDLSVSGVPEAVAALAAERPYLLKATEDSPPRPPELPATPQGDGRDDRATTDAERMAARQVTQRLARSMF